jgi:hypothetical protein
VDGLAMWDAEDVDDAAPTPTLPVIRPDQNERLLTLFTGKMARTSLHYLKSKAIEGYMRCNGPDCLLCRIGNKPDVRDLLPVYDLVSRVVAVLPISPNLRPHALRPQVAPLLRRLAGGEAPILMTLKREGQAKFLVGDSPLPEGADDGAAAIRVFQDMVQAGHIDLAASFQQLANEDLAMIDEVRIAMKAKGIHL